MERKTFWKKHKSKIIIGAMVITGLAAIPIGVSIYNKHDSKFNLVDYLNKILKDTIWTCDNAEAFEGIDDDHMKVVINFIKKKES